MKFTSFKQIIANFLLMSEFVALFFLLCAAIQGSLPLLAALGYAAGSFLATNFLASLLVSTSSPVDLRPVPVQDLPDVRLCDWPWRVNAVTLPDFCPINAYFPIHAWILPITAQNLRFCPLASNPAPKQVQAGVLCCCAPCYDTDNNKHGGCIEIV